VSLVGNGGDSPIEYYLSKPWVKHYDKGVPEDIEDEIPEMPLYNFLVDTATNSKYSTKPATVFIVSSKLQVTRTYSEIFDMARRFAGFLRKIGVGKGDVVAIYLPNTPQFIVAYYGSLLAGAIVTTISILNSASEIFETLRKSGAKVLIAFNLGNFADNAREAAETASKEGLPLKAVVWTGVEDAIKSPFGRLMYWMAARKHIRKPPRNAEFENVRFSDIVKKHRPLSEDDYADVNPKKDTAVLMFTGGTTGVPKGVELTHYNLVSNVYQIDAWYERGRKGVDVFVGALPWFHIYGQTAVMNAAIFRAGTILVFPRFNPRLVMEAIHRYHATLFHAVPLMYQMILNEIERDPSLLDRYNLKSLEACISGASPLPVAVAERFEEITGAKLREGYGLTEASPVTHVNPILGDARPGSIGLPLPSTIAAIADPERPEILPPGVAGELVVSGPQVMKGYWGDPHATERAIFTCCGRRWLRTGDIAYMDSDGYFYIIDRKKDIIKYKGYSVYPREIEEILYRHPCVLEAAVIGKPHKDYFEIPKAFIILKQACREKPIEEVRRDIMDFLRRHLAPYKVPKEIEFVEKLPKSSVGKILRRKLREREEGRMRGEV